MPPLICHLFALPALVGRLPAEHGWLSESEHARLATLRHPARRQQYLYGHWLARQALAESSGLDWRECVLDEGQGAGPQPTSAAAGLHVSISHSGDWLAAAAATQRIGIDLELRGRRHGLRAIAAALAAQSETPADLDDESLLQRWVAKEAWIKASHGAALPDRLAQIVLDPTVARPTGWIGVRSDARIHLGWAAAATMALSLRGPLACASASERQWRVLDQAG